MKINHKKIDDLKFELVSRSLKDYNSSRISSQETTLVQKGFFVVLMLVSNGLVWRYFVKGLHSNDSSTLVPTVISTASNFIVSALLGSLVFAEKTSLTWWIGAAMILSGLFCIVSEDEKLQVKKE